MAVALRRESVVALASVLMTTSVLANAFYRKQQFYPAMVHLSKSKTSMAALYLQAIVVFYYVAKTLKLVFFGQLRHQEVENLMERCWYALTDTALAFTAFRDEFTPVFFGLFCLLLFIKATHSLVNDRIDYMERTPVLSRTFHVRIISLLSLLSFFDIVCLLHAFNLVLVRGASLQLVFGFEYTILLLTATYVCSKYILNCFDIYAAPAGESNQWNQKSFILMHIEMIISGLKVMLYIVFFSVMVRYYHFPLFAIRPLYMTLRAFRKSLYDIILSRRALKLLNSFARPTLQEILSGDTTCIICREEMSNATNCTKLPCSHILHTACLSSWFQRQQTCPLCRESIFRLRQQQQQAAAGGPAAAGGGAGFRFGGIQPPTPQQQQQQQQPNLFGFGGHFHPNNLPQPFIIPGGALFPPFPPNQQQQQQQHNLFFHHHHHNDGMQLPPGMAAMMAAAQQQQQLAPANTTTAATTTPTTTGGVGAPSTSAPSVTTTATTAAGVTPTPTTTANGVPFFSPPLPPNFGGTFPQFFTPPPPPPDPSWMLRMPAGVVQQLVQGMPMPPTGDLSRIAIDQLRAMEHDERRALEARIDYLRRAQVCIDSAVALMDAYFSAFPATAHATTSASTPNAVQTSSEQNSSSTAAASVATVGDDEGQKNPDEPTPSTSSNGNDKDSNNNNITPASQHELRRRRVEKLQQPNL